MIAPDLETAVERLRDLVEEARVIVPFTGAGISTECGIPDFRSPGGIWTKMRPIEFGDFLASQEMRNESWRRRFAMEEQFGGAKPGRGHRALASLYRAGKVPAVVTQNIDNLHQASGFAADRRGRAARQHHLCHLPRLRQTLRIALGEGADGPRQRLRARLPDCGGYIKTATVSFGQSMPDGSDAPGARACRILRSFHRHRLVAGGLAGRGLPARSPSATARGL